MEANKAPEKIYVDSKAIGDDISTTVHTNRQDYPTCTEYTLTDAFIKKACTYLKSIGHKYVIDGFRNYMKGEQSMEKENKNNDLCKSCEHYWQDFPLPLEKVISHCEILDEKHGLEVNMEDIVPYPCLKCPFDCYSKK